MDGARDLKTTLRELAAALEEDLRDHPEAEELLAYALGDLPSTEREEMEEHLALCRDCARTVLALKARPDLKAAEEDLPAAEVAAEWERFRIAAGAPVQELRPRRPAVPPPHLAWALAAGLLLAVAGLTWRVSELTRALHESSDPRADVFVADLSPLGQGVDRSEAGAAGAEEVRVPAWADRVVLILALTNLRSAPEYRVEVVQNGREVWRGSGVRRTQDGTLVLELPRRLLGSGVNRLRLYASAEAVEPVARYAFRVVED